MRIDPGNISVPMIDAAGLALLLVLTAGAYFLGLKPILGHRAAQAADRATLAQKQHVAATLQTTLTTMRRHVAQSRQMATNHPNSHLRSVDQLNETLTRITTLAARTHVRISRLKMDPPRHEHDFVTVPIHMNGAGSFPDSVRLLHELHEQMPDVTIASLDMTGQAAAAGDAGLHFELQWYAAVEE